jgi:tyrosine-protein kinase
VNIGDGFTSGPGGSDLRRELRVLWAHRWLILATTVVMVGLAAAYTFLKTPIYTATAKTLIKPTGVNLADLGAGGAIRLISPETEAEVATSQEVALVAAATLGSDATPETLLKHVSVSVPANAQILEMHYSDPLPEKARAGAQAFADAYLVYRQEQAVADVSMQQAQLSDQADTIRKQIAELNATIASSLQGSVEYRDASTQKQQLLSQATLLQLKQAELASINTDPGVVVSHPVLPTTPSSPNHELDLALGLFSGLFLGVGFGFLKHRTDNRLRERHQLEQTLGSPVLSVIPRVEGWRNRDEAKLITVTDPLAPASEAYRVLRPVILAAAAAHEVKTIMVVSPMAGEGKSTTAANLAVVLAQSGRSVALVSVDLRRPRVHEFFELSKEPGIADFLTDNATVEEIGRRCETVGGELRVFPSGRLRAQPSELLQSRQMQRFLEDQREAFDFVILDCPPVLAVSDALPLIPLSDGVLFVADADTTTREQVSHARERLQQMGANILGAVINGLAPTTSGYYDYRYAYSYPSSNGSGSKRSRRLVRRNGSGG